MCAVSQGRGGTRSSRGGGWFAGAAARCAARVGGDWRGTHLFAREAKPETITRVVLDDHEAATAASDVHDGRKDRIARRARKHGPGDSCGEHASSHPPGMRRLVPRAAARDERHLALVNRGTDHDIVTFNALQIWVERDAIDHLIDHVLRVVDQLRAAGIRAIAVSGTRIESLRSQAGVGCGHMKEQVHAVARHMRHSVRSRALGVPAASSP